MTNSKALTPAEVALLDAVTAKRAKTVLDHIRKHGYITTDELKTLYGYNHPPRAARDVREEGIPLVTGRVPGPDGRSIAAYELGDLSKATASKLGGRQAFPKKLKDEVLARDGERCAVCGSRFPAAALQLDHKVPYEVAGDSVTLAAAEFMLLDGSCNRGKSWSCEHCRNWIVDKDPAACRNCYWASPASYSHIALEARRQMTVTWAGEEAADYDAFVAEAAVEGTDPQTLAKDAMRVRGLPTAPS